MPSVTSQYSDGSHELRSASPAAPEPLPTTTAAKYATTAYHTVPTRVGAVSALYGSDGSSSRHSLDRLSASRDSLQATNAATPPPPPLPKRGEGPLAAAEGRFDGHFTKYLKQQQQPQCYDEPKPARLGSPLRDNYVERVGSAATLSEPAALSPASVPLDLSKKKKPDAVFRYKEFQPIFSHLSYFSSFVLVCSPSFKFVL